MSMVDANKKQVEDARERLLRKFHDLRGVLWSDLSLSEKGRLFVKVSDELLRDAALAYPDLSAEVRNGVRPIGTPPHHCSEESLKNVIERLNQILGYRRHAAEFRILADKVREIYDSSASQEEKKAAMALLINPLLVVTKGMGKHGEIVNCSYDGFHHRTMEDWVHAIEKAAASV